MAPLPFDILEPHLLRRQQWLIEQRSQVEKAIEDLDKQIHALLHGDDVTSIPPHPYARILFSFPTMSDTWACTLLGTIGEIDRFTTFRQFRRYLGFAAETAQSGTSVRGSHLTHGGGRDSRRVLFQIMLTLLSPNTQPSVFRACYHRILERERNTSKMRVMGFACGKLCNAIYACLRQGVPYDPRRHAKDCGIPWEAAFLGKNRTTDSDAFADEADQLAEESEE